MSGSYVPQELGAEFGKIPPSFLPLGNKRLFQHQIALSGNSCPIFITLPDDYHINHDDKVWLDDNHANILRIDSQLSLGQALVTAWNLIEEKKDKTVKLLFGDTLLNTMPAEYDIVAVGQSHESYQWSQFNADGIYDNDSSHYENVICGYFTFSNFHRFIKYVLINKFSFTSALNSYKDDIGLTPIGVTDWLDFGHTNTYYQSKVKYTTQRAFNDLSITEHSVQKSSSNNNKIHAEANWFKTIPEELRLYTPQYLGMTPPPKLSYKLEYLYNTALNEIFVFSELPTAQLIHIIKRCLNFIDNCRVFTTPKNNTNKTMENLLTIKTEQRVNEYVATQNFNINAKWKYNAHEAVSIRDILEHINCYLPQELELRTVMHGDLCFSNVLYDFRTSRVKVIDPRGITHHNELTIYGDYRYDLAKLSHSILGLYDWIIAGYHKTDIDTDNHLIQQSITLSKRIADVQPIFNSMIENKYQLSLLSLYAMQIHLFFSMLPLHNDDINRQNGLFANAFRLYQELKRIEA